MIDINGKRILAACPLTANADSINGMSDRFGTVVAKTVTADPVRFMHKFGDGNILRVGDGSMINAIGLANPGCEAAAADLRRAQRGMDAIQSIHGSAPGEYGRIIRAFDGVPCVKAYEVNVSCPDVDMACEGTNPETIHRITKLTDKPIIVKISHEQVDLAPEYVENGASHITAINTIPAAVFSDNGVCEGGLSGESIRPVALRAVRRLAECGIKAIGCGGIATDEDVAEFTRAGAMAVQMATGVMLDRMG